jgi:3-hydroxyacyl-CoA dehydrogenase
MAHNICAVGVVGTGVLGASWTCLFIAKGLRVLVSDPAPEAKERLDAFLHRMWPTMDLDTKDSGVEPDFYEFVDDMMNNLDKVDFIQEVEAPQP